MMRILAVTTLSLGLVIALNEFFLPTCQGQQGIKADLDGKSMELLPLGWNNQSVAAVQRNGFLIQTEPNKLKNPEILPRFRPFTQGEARGDLMKEFSSGFEITGTGTYLVVHPQGKADEWAQRFENQYRSFIHFFRSRGYPVERLQFPLVGVVFHNREQYLHYLSALGSGISGTAGVYLSGTNRVYLFDGTRGLGEQSPEWAETISTVMHEAAHQVAFNLGIHHRVADQPRWVVEGLGALFEARGIYDSFQFSRIEDRVVPRWLKGYQERVKPHADRILASLVTSDRGFKSDTETAYSAAWGMTFYLSEREPRNYMRFLQAVNDHDCLEKYTAEARLKDFTRIMGTDFAMLAARINRFIDEFPSPAR